MRKIAIAVLCSLLLPLLASSQTKVKFSPEVRAFVKEDAPVIALTHVRVIDGTGAPARSGQTLVIADGKIIGLGDAATTKIPDGAKVLDLSGYTVIPGLVANINDIEKVDTVFKDGVGYDSAKLIESVQGLVGLR